MDKQLENVCAGDIVGLFANRSPRRLKQVRTVIRRTAKQVILDEQGRSRYWIENGHPVGMGKHSAFIHTVIDVPTEDELQEYKSRSNLG